MYKIISTYAYINVKNYTITYLCSFPKDILTVIVALRFIVIYNGLKPTVVESILGLRSV
jgi:hypothetical protein